MIFPFSSALPHQQLESKLCPTCPFIHVVVPLIASWYYNFTHTGNKHPVTAGTEVRLFCQLKKQNRIENAKNVRKETAHGSKEGNHFSLKCFKDFKVWKNGHDLNQVGHEIPEWECLFKFRHGLQSQGATEAQQPNHSEDTRQTKSSARQRLTFKQEENEFQSF